MGNEKPEAVVQCKSPPAAMDRGGIAVQSNLIHTAPSFFDILLAEEKSRFPYIGSRQRWQSQFDEKLVMSVSAFDNIVL